jgi:hypothetical protein
MTRLLVTWTLVGLCSVALHADLSFTTVTTIEGGAAAMAGGVAPRMVTRIKGSKVRTEVSVMGQTISTIADVATRQVTVLHPEQKMAQVMDAAAVSTTTPAGALPAGPKFDTSFTPTGRNQVIDGVACDEYTFAMTMSMADKAKSGQAGQAAPANPMLQDMLMKMNGSIWMAKSGPAVAEFVAFQKAALDAQMASVLAGSMSSDGMERLLRGLANGNGMPFLTEMTMTFDGAGPAADMMKQMGPMKLTSKISELSTEPIGADLFTVPADYTIKK